MRRLAAATGAVLVVSGAAAGLRVTAATAASPAAVRAEAALAYLYGQVGPGGDIAGSVGATEDVVISDADNGFDPATLRNPVSGTSSLTYLANQASSITTAGGAAKYVLAWVAAGRPATIDGATQLSRLNTPVSRGGYLTPVGTFHNRIASVEAANSYSQALAILADVATGQALPAQATAWLTCAQRADGGFGYAINDSHAVPPASCGDTASDTNDTGMILQALGSAGVTSTTSAATAYLHRAQQPDGGFGFVAAGPSDPDSDAVVIQGLVAIGQDPTTWAVGAADPITSLLSFADPHGSGGFIFPGNAAPDAFTTGAIPQALALKPYGAPAPFTVGLTPVASTSTPTPTPIPTPHGVAGITVPATGGGLPLGPGVALLAAGLMGLLVATRRRSVLP